MSQKVEAIKSQIKYQKVVLKKNPEDKKFNAFSFFCSPTFFVLTQHFFLILVLVFFQVFFPFVAS
jgi:hypothetical protein